MSHVSVVSLLHTGGGGAAGRRATLGLFFFFSSWKWRKFSGIILCSLKEERKKERRKGLGIGMFEGFGGSKNY